MRRTEKPALSTRALEEASHYRLRRLRAASATGPTSKARRLLTWASQVKAHRFAYVSAASIVIHPGRPTHGDGSLPVLHDRSMHYSATKGLAERIVLEANGGEMSTIASPTVHLG